MEGEQTESLLTNSDDEVDFSVSKPAKKSALLSSDDESESGSETKLKREDKELSDFDDDGPLVESNENRDKKFNRVKRLDSSDSEEENGHLDLSGSKDEKKANIDEDSDHSSSQTSVTKENENDNNPESDSSDDENGSSTGTEKDNTSIKEKTYEKLFKDDIYDAEGSSEEENEVKKTDDLLNEAVSLSPKKKKTKSGRGSSKSGTSGKKPKQEVSEIDEIHKETQRMVRESRVSLPYHIPRQRTLQDFLNRRKSVPKIPLKSNSQDLSIVWKHIEERERTAESFYNSESDESDKEESNATVTNKDPALDEAPTSVSTQVPNESYSLISKSTGLLESKDSDLSLLSVPLDSDNTSVDPMTSGKPDNTEEPASVDNEQSKNESGFHSLENSDPEKDLENCDTKPMDVDEDILSQKDSLDADNSECQTDLLKNNEIKETTEVENSSKSEFTFFGVSWSDDDTEQKCSEKKAMISDQTSEEKKVMISEQTSEDKTDNNENSFTRDNLTKSLLECIDKPSEEIQVESLGKSEEEKVTVDKSATPISLLADTKVLEKVPKLSCGPGDEIDLDRPIGGAKHLLKRFMKHVKLKGAIPKENKTVKLRVLNVESSAAGEVTSMTEEELTISSQETKPGQRLCALKQSLKKSIEVSRSQLHAKRLEQYKLYEQEFNDGEGGDAKQIDEDDEFENEIFGDKDADEGDTKNCSDDEIEDTEDEEEEKLSGDDELDETEEKPNKKTSKKRLDFADDEAEVSQDENEESDEDDGEGGVSDSYSVSHDSPAKSKKSPGDFDDYFASQESVDKKIDLQGLGLDKDSDEETDLFGLCSGKFQTQPVSLTQLEDDSESYNPSTPAVESTENLFSQEMFSQSVTRPAKILDSDEEDGEGDKVNAAKSTIKAKRLQFSDDEDEENVENNDVKEDESEEEEMNQDEEEGGSCDEAIDDAEQSQENKVVYYDSEEEIVEGRKFLEAEAELSGSEASEDEDEQGLSDFEADEADMEKINQRKLKSELERIHIQDIMAQDKREIRLLQELLLEDGELHSDGPKRQRLFRWSNQEDVDSGNIGKKVLSDDEGGGADEEEEEHQWRKERIEREQFLNSTRQEDEGDVLDENVNIPVCDKKAVKQPLPKIQPNLLNSPDPKQPFKLLTNRGSFLGRSEKILSKLAGLAAPTDQQQQRVKRNMTFSVVSPPKQNDHPAPEVEKRKAEESLPRVTKRLKFNQSAVNTSRGLGIIQKLMEADQGT